MPRESTTEILQRLGIDADRVELVALLPLVRVAWADGVVQPAERDMIFALAEQHGLLSSADRLVLEGWLSEAPSHYFCDSADRAIADLAESALPNDLTGQSIVDCCWELARAAGGLFGTRLMAVSAAERAALEAIAAALGVTDASEVTGASRLPAGG